jgi:hypothetical protein
MRYIRTRCEMWLHQSMCSNLLCRWKRFHRCRIWKKWFYSYLMTMTICWFVAESWIVRYCLKKICRVVIDQYIFEFTIVIFWRDKNDVNVWYQDKKDDRIIFRDESVFKYLVSKHFNDCRECFDVIYRFNEDEKCFKFVVIFDDEFIIRNFILWDIIDDQFFEILNEEFVYFIIFVIDNKLFKTTFQFWTCFVCRITIDKTFFRFLAFFFDMIRWSTCRFITYKAYFRCTRTRIKRKSIVVTIFEEFTTILSICEAIIVKWVIDVLKIRMICWFICCFSIDDINAERINKERRIHWWIMQFDDECRMIFACLNEIFVKIIQIVIFEINVLL